MDVEPRSPHRDRMGSRDAGFLYLERPHAPLHIACVAVLDRPIQLEALARRVEARLPRMRRYAQRAVEVPLSLGHPLWRDDPDFEVRRHLHRWSLPAPGGETELEELVAELLTRPLDRSQPLWEMHLVEGLHGGRAALVQKVHHCMVDGLAGAQLLEVLLDDEPEAEPAPPPASAAAALPGPSRRLGGALREGAARGARLSAGMVGALLKPAAAREAVTRLRNAAWSALQLAVDDVPEMPWNRRLSPRRRLCFTRLPFEGVRRVRAARGGTVNDVVLCVLAGGLRRYLVASGRSALRRELAALVPVSLRSADEARSLGNRISAMLVPLAVDVESEIARLAATRGITFRLKEDSAWVGIDGLLSLLDEMPPALVAFAARQLRIGRLASCVCTNVPGPRETRFLGEACVEALYPVVPIADGIGLGLAVFSYDGWLHVGLNADAETVPDLDKLARGIEDAFQELLGAA